jgi:hypothetical protein
MPDSDTEALFRAARTNPNISRVWLLVGALRSGLYSKGRERLHKIITTTAEDGTKTTKDEWCCLGVGSDVYVKFGGSMEREISPFHHAERGQSSDVRVDEEFFNDNSSFFEPEVRDFFGFTSDNPVLIFEGETYTASELNDCGVRIRERDDQGRVLDGRREVSFEEIAQAFDETYLKEEVSE